MPNMKNIQAQLKQVADGKAAANAPAPVEATERPAKATRQASRKGKVLIGGWGPGGFKNSPLMGRAQTGEGGQTILGRAPNEGFRAPNVPVIGEEGAEYENRNKGRD
jgi:hypothetical protein